MRQKQKNAHNISFIDTIKTCDITMKRSVCTLKNYSILCSFYFSFFFSFYSVVLYKLITVIVKSFVAEHEIEHISLWHRMNEAENVKHMFHRTNLDLRLIIQNGIIKSNRKIVSYSFVQLLLGNKVINKILFHR